MSAGSQFERIHNELCCPTGIWATGPLGILEGPLLFEESALPLFEALFVEMAVKKRVDEPRQACLDAVQLCLKLRRSVEGGLLVMTLCGSCQRLPPAHLSGGRNMREDRPGRTELQEGGSVAGCSTYVQRRRLVLTGAALASVLVAGCIQDVASHEREHVSHHEFVETRPIEALPDFCGCLVNIAPNRVRQGRVTRLTGTYPSALVTRLKSKRGRRRIRTAEARPRAGLFALDLCSNRSDGSGNRKCVALVIEGGAIVGNATVVATDARVGRCRVCGCYIHEPRKNKKWATHR
mgnify:CR=1 FL=1